METIIKWLNQQEPWTVYRTKTDLLDKDISDPEVIQDYEKLVNHNNILHLLKELQEWPGPVMKRHNDAKLLYHKLVFLADLGIKSDNQVIANVIDKILAKPSSDGPFQILGNIPAVFGGTGIDEPMWMLCDAPLIVYALVKSGLQQEPKVKKAIDYLLSIIRDFGWPCSATSRLGKKFKGPGKRTHPCPYANLIMLKLLSALPEMHNSSEVQKGADVLLELWEHRREIKYFLFGMGTDFKKLKAPFVWFDILHVTDVLTNFSFTRGDSRLQEMVKIIRDKADEKGLYKAESVYRAWKDWDFGQKKDYSAWITLLVYRILKRTKAHS